jgi:hypothetical protein
MSLVRRVVGVVGAIGIISFGSVKIWKCRGMAASDATNGILFAMKVSARKDCSVTPYIVADRLGFLAEEGLHIRWTGETQPALLVPSLVRGDNDVAELTPDILAVAKASGARLTGVAEARIEPVDPHIDPRYRSTWWFINPDTLPNANSIADVGLSIVGRKIRFSKGAPSIGDADFESKLLADKYGIRLDRIEWISVADAEAIDALKLGFVDVSAVHFHFYSAMLKAGARKIADSSETGLGRAAGITYWTFRDQFIEEHPDKVAAWARALRRAQVWTNANSDGARRLTEEAIGEPVTDSQYYSESKGVDGELSARWLVDLVQSGMIPPGKVTTKSLVTQEIALRNESFYASRGSVSSRP